MEEMCSEYFRENEDSIKIKKEHVFIKNLSSIIDTTLKLSIHKGFQNMSLRDLCKESGLSMGALYSYISSKGQLVTMVHAIGQRMVSKVMKALIKNEMPASEKLETAICSHLFLSELMHNWFYFFFMETKNLNREGQKKSIMSEQGTEKIYLDILAEGTESNIFKVSDPLLTASVIKAMMQDWYLKQWKYKKRKISVDRYAEFILQCVNAIIKT